MRRSRHPSHVASRVSFGAGYDHVRVESRDGPAAGRRRRRHRLRAEGERPRRASFFSRRLVRGQGRVRQRVCTGVSRASTNPSWGSTLVWRRSSESVRKLQSQGAKLKLTGASFFGPLTHPPLFNGTRRARPFPIPFDSHRRRGSSPRIRGARYPRHEASGAARTRPRARSGLPMERSSTPRRSGARRAPPSPELRVRVPAQSSPSPESSTLPPRVSPRRSTSGVARRPDAPEIGGDSPRASRAEPSRACQGRTTSPASRRPSAPPTATTTSARSPRPLLRAREVRSFKSTRKG